MNSDPLHLRTWSNPCKWLWFDGFYSCHPVKGLRCKTSENCDHDYKPGWGARLFLLLKLHLRSEKASCPLVLWFKKKKEFLFDAKIKAFSKALWCARQKDMQADSGGGLSFSNYQHSLNLTPQTEFLCEVDNHTAECISSEPCGFSIK